MGKALVRTGDPSDHGGYMVSSSSWINCGGKLLCLHQDLHFCPQEGHGTTPVSSTSRVLARGRPVLRVGDKALCGATIIAGDGNTNSV
jgi:uncharacterized Zn-binding protein involved in type VI secretion